MPEVRLRDAQRYGQEAEILPVASCLAERPTTVRALAIDVSYWQRQSGMGLTCRFDCVRKCGTLELCNPADGGDRATAARPVTSERKRRLKCHPFGLITLKPALQVSDHIGQALPA